mgnify:CR=1 FL=1
MNPSLARGYATQFIQRCPSTSDYYTFRDHGIRNLLVEFSASFFTKISQRAIKRMKRHKGPFQRLHMLEWRKAQKSAYLDAYFGAEAADIYSFSGSQDPIFQERLILNLFVLLEANSEGVKMIADCRGGISHHAITRMLERNAVDPSGLIKAVDTLFNDLVALQNAMQEAFAGDRRQYGLLVPFKEGAVPVCFVGVNATMGLESGKDEILMARTYLAPEMLSAEQRERMAGFKAPSDPTSTEGEWIAWLKKNARPFEFGKEPA